MNRLCASAGNSGTGSENARHHLSHPTSEQFAFGHHPRGIEPHHGNKRLNEYQRAPPAPTAKAQTDSSIANSAPGTRPHKAPTGTHACFRSPRGLRPDRYPAHHKKWNAGDKAAFNSVMGPKSQTLPNQTRKPVRNRIPPQYGRNVRTKLQTSGKISGTCRDYTDDLNSLQNRPTVKFTSGSRITSTNAISQSIYPGTAPSTSTIRRGAPEDIHSTHHRPERKSPTDNRAQPTSPPRHPHLRIAKR